jgi:sortase (surface protein transpeptidase)
MAEKKKPASTKQNRQRKKSPLPIKTAQKKAAAARKRKPASSKTKAKPANARTAKRAPRKRTPKSSTIREVRIPLWSDRHILIQLNSTKPARKKKPTRKPSADADFLSRLRRVPLSSVLLVLGLAGTVYFATDILRSPEPLTVYSPPAPEVQAAPASEAKMAPFPRSEPVSLRIADIGIDVPLTTVGRQADETLEVPESADIPGWYRYSPTPGELGPAIIVGHVDSPGKPGVFWRLRELRPGQNIDLRREDGTSVRFKITDVEQFEQDAFPTEKVYGNIDHAGLRLITCGGSFNRLTGQYSHNTVVFATLVQ